MIIRMRATHSPCSHCGQTVRRQLRTRLPAKRGLAVQCQSSWRASAVVPLRGRPEIECLLFRTTTFGRTTMQPNTLRISTNQRVSSPIDATFPPSASQHSQLPLSDSLPTCASSHVSSVIASTFSSFSSSLPSWSSVRLSLTGCLSPTLFPSQFQLAPTAACL